MLQESEGCVRVRTTSAAGSTTIFNPGLMQDHSGLHSCNPHGTEMKPCPYEQIYGMIQDGVAGTTAGDGLAACLNEAVKLSPSNSTVPPPKSEAQAYYMAARLYNSGVLDPAGILDNASGSTGCYCSDIANRLTGWTAADPKFPKTCCLDTTCMPKTAATSKRSIYRSEESKVEKSCGRMDSMIRGDQS
jgi:hypothetical protein